MPSTVNWILNAVFWLPRYWVAAVNWNGQIGHMQFIGFVGHYFAPAVPTCPCARVPNQDGESYIWRSAKHRRTKNYSVHKGKKKKTNNSKVIPEHLHNQPWSPIFHFHCTSNCAVDQDSFKVFSWKTTLKVFGTSLPRDFLPNQRLWGWQYGRSVWGVIKVFVLADTTCTK